MQRPSCPTIPPLLAKRARNRKRVGIDLNNRIERRAVPVDSFDPLKIQLDETFSRKLPATHSCLKLRNCGLFKLRKRLPMCLVHNYPPNALNTCKMSIV